MGSSLAPPLQTPAARSPGVALAHGITLASVLAFACTLVFYFMVPDLFIVLAPTLLVCLALMAVSGFATILNPPRWADVGLIVFAFCMMDFTIRKGGVAAGGFDVQSVIKGLVWVIALIYGAVHGHKLLFKGGLLQFSLALYCLFAFATAFYSKAIMLGVGSGIALVAIAFYAAHITSWPRERVHTLWRVLFFSIAFVAFVSLAMYFVLPEWARDLKASGAGRLRGVTGSGNSMGPISAIGVLAGLYVVASSRSAGARAVALVLTIVVAVVLLLTQSRGSMIGLAGAFIIVLALRNFVVAAFSLAGGVVALWFLLQPEWLDGLISSIAGLLSRSGRVDEITSFTGRSDIWAAIIPRIAASPWFGYGLGSPRIVVSEAYVGRWGQTYESAHNWFLEALISFGVVGAAMLAGFLVLLAWQVWRLRGQVHRSPIRYEGDHALAICMQRCIVLLLINGLMEKSFAGMPSPSTVLLAVLTGSCLALSKAYAPLPPPLPGREAVGRS